LQADGVLPLLSIPAFMLSSTADFRQFCTAVSLFFWNRSVVRKKRFAYGLYPMSAIEDVKISVFVSCVCDLENSYNEA